MTASRSPVYPITLVSGATALIYEVLWLEELELLFGSTAQAAATTLAVFFLGLALGSRVGGSWAAGSRNPLRLYAGIEGAIALTALLYFGLLGLFELAYGPLMTLVGGQRVASVAIKLVLATVVLLPPSFFMGATLPALVQHLVRREDALGRTGSLLYAVNVLGAAIGAFAAGFVMPRALGYDRSYLVAVALNLAIAAVALGLSFLPDAARLPGPAAAAADPPPGGSPAASGAHPIERRLPPALLWTIALGSGFLTLGLEVLWTRLFALVLHKSVYTFTAILIVFLLALAIGSILASLLCRVSLQPAFVLWGLLMVGGAAAAASCGLFLWRMEGLTGVRVGQGWSGYQRGVLASTAITIGVPVVLMGAVFPYLLRLAEGLRRAPGELLGRLAAWNTIGAIAGSLVAGFVLVATLGVWSSIHLLGLGYIALAVLVAAVAVTRRASAGVLSALGLAIVLASATIPYPLVRLLEGEELIEVWEGAHGTVAVVEKEDNRRITLNNHYSIGGSAAAHEERRQTHLPLLLHPAPKRVFFLGMGTGITAGAALDHPVETVVVAELVPEIVTAARAHFEPLLNGLFEDERVSLVLEDGRNWLRAFPDEYDVIVADLFTPWNPGTGSLYSLEHFRTVRSRLAEGGLFAQWLPLHQVSEHEFGVIVRTMLEVFPHVTLWRGDFFALGPNVMLAGQLAPSPLDPAGVRHRAGVLEDAGSWEAWERIATPFIFYGGNPGQARELFERYPLNTDDRPVIEYDAPVTYHRQKAKQASWLEAEELVALYDRLFERVPLERDPHLGRLHEVQRGHVRAGMALYRFSVARKRGRQEEAQRQMDEFQRFVTAGL